jgi:peptidoglycan/LPS O-acetylase OafA/YrhL
MYLIFPFLVPYFFGAKKIKTIVILLLLIAAYVLIRYLLGPISNTQPVGRPTVDLVADFGVLRCAAGFCLGMLLFVFYEEKSAYKIFSKSWCFILFFSIALFGVYASVIDIVVIALFPFVLLSAAHNKTAIKKILSTEFLQRLGDWSFSIYMVHGPIILMLFAFTVYRHPDIYSSRPLVAGSSDAGSISPAYNANYKISLLYCLVIVIATLIVSAFTYRFVEIPVGKYLKRVFKPKQSATFSK